MYMYNVHVHVNERGKNIIQNHVHCTCINVLLLQSVCTLYQLYCRNSPFTTTNNWDINYRVAKKFVGVKV